MEEFTQGQWVRIKTYEEIKDLFHYDSEGIRMIRDIYMPDLIIPYLGAAARISEKVGEAYTLKDFSGVPFMEDFSWVFPKEILEDAFSVGSRVRIRSWESMVEEFGTNGYGSIPCRRSFTESMRHLCGRFATITGRSFNGSVGLRDWSDDSGTVWRYSEDMIEPVPCLTVSVDFDGTITGSHIPGTVGFNKIKDGCKRAMDLLHKMGVNFYLLTGRQEHLQEALNLCKGWNLPIFTFQPNTKKITDFYIDDKDISCTEIDWENIYAFLYSVMEKRLGKVLMNKIMGEENV